MADEVRWAERAQLVWCESVLQDLRDACQGGLYGYTVDYHWGMMQAALGALATQQRARRGGL